MTDEEKVSTVVNRRWDLRLPDHRHDFHVQNPMWEAEHLASMHDRIPPGSLVIDVGAEEGDLAGLFASWGHSVALVECKPESWANIRAVWELNDLPHPAGMFVGFASDVTDLHPPNRYPGADGYRLAPDGWPAASRGEPGPCAFAHLAQQTDSIPQTTLDDFAEGFTVGAVTIDTEGSELRVLHGAGRILAEDRPHVWVSVHSDRAWMDDLYDGAGVDDVTAHLQARGYRCEVLSVDHELHLYAEPT